MAYVLIIDDDEDFADAIARVARSAGYEADTVLQTKNALPKITERRPDLIILDVMFPEDSSGGFEIARQIRGQRQELQDVPILMLTAINSKFSLGFSSGDIDESWLPVDDFIEKPIDFDVLLQKVKTLLQKNGVETPEAAS